MKVVDLGGKVFPPRLLARKVTHLPIITQGDPCNVHGCSRCCKEALVTLTEGDIRRIVAAGHKVGDFLKSIGEYLSLHHGPNGCIFLIDDRCSIYSCRPVHCQTYPIIAAADGTPGRDQFCPYGNEFYLDPAAAKLNVEATTTEDLEAAERRAVFATDPSMDSLSRPLREKVGWVLGSDPSR